MAVAGEAGPGVVVVVDGGQSRVVRLLQNLWIAW